MGNDFPIKSSLSISGILLFSLILSSVAGESSIQVLINSCGTSSSPHLSAQRLMVLGSSADQTQEQ